MDHPELSQKQKKSSIGCPNQHKPASADLAIKFHSFSHSDSAIASLSKAQMRTSEDTIKFDQTDHKQLGKTIKSTPERKQNDLNAPLTTPKPMSHLPKNNQKVIHVVEKCDDKSAVSSVSGDSLRRHLNGYNDNQQISEQSFHPPPPDVIFIPTICKCHWATNCSDSLPTTTCRLSQTEKNTFDPKAISIDPLSLVRREVSVPPKLAGYPSSKINLSARNNPDPLNRNSFLPVQNGHNPNQKEFTIPDDAFIVDRSCRKNPHDPSHCISNGNFAEQCSRVTETTTSSVSLSPSNDITSHHDQCYGVFKPVSPQRSMFPRKKWLSSRSVARTNDEANLGDDVEEPAEELFVKLPERRHPVKRERRHVFGKMTKPMKLFGRCGRAEPQYSWRQSSGCFA